MATTIKEISDDLGEDDRRLLADACAGKALFGSIEKLKLHRLVYVERVGIMSDLKQFSVTRAGFDVAAELKRRAALPTPITSHEKFNGEYQSGFVA